MAYVSTSDMLSAIKDKVAAIPHPTAAGALFEVVNYYDNEKLAEALSDLIIVKQRVCLIVPAGDDFENSSAKTSGLVMSKQYTAFDLLIADRDYSKGQDAVFGGMKNVGVIAMKDIVRKTLVGSSIGIEGVSFLPTGGNQITLGDDEVKDVPGRECYVLPFIASAGFELIPTGD